MRLIIGCVCLPSRITPLAHARQFSSETSKLRGFRVVVAGVPLSDNEVQLKFRRVKLLRRSRWLKSVVIPLPPSGLLRAFSRWASRGKGQLSNRGAGFQLLYLDDELRMHQTVRRAPPAFSLASAWQQLLPSVHADADACVCVRVVCVRVARGRVLLPSGALSSMGNTLSSYGQPPTTRPSRSRRARQPPWRLRPLPPQARVQARRR